MHNRQEMSQRQQDMLEVEDTIVDFIRNFFKQPADQAVANELADAIVRGDHLEEQ